MGFLEVLLALVGLAALVAIAGGFIAAWYETEARPADADPYRDGLDAAARISAAAWEAAQAIHRAAEHQEQEGE